MTLDNKNLWPLTLLKLMMVVLTGIVVYTGIEYYKQRELEGVARRAQENQQRLISLELETFKTTSDIVATLMFDDTTRQLLYDATHGGDEEKIRRTLYRRYAPIYKKLADYKLRHFQFHLPDGRSFLRIHKADVYGDSLLEIRPSIAKIVKTHKPLYGFETGRYLEAYRAIYPLFYRGNYVGSVELSFTFDVMKRMLERIHRGSTQYYLILDFKELKKVVDWKRLHAYRRCFIDPDFVINEKCAQTCRKLKSIGFKTDLSSYREFSKIVQGPDRYFYILSFLPLRMIDGHPGGYYIVIQKDTGAVAGVVSGARIALIALALAVLVAILLIVMLHIYRIKARAAELDALTGAYNRRGCLRRLGNNGKRYALLFVDIDHFKQINDTYGHDVGDEVLKTVARIMATHIRREDVLCRYGGEEFLVFVSNASQDQARMIAEKLRKHIQIHRFDGVENVTVSIGIAIRRRNESIGSLIARADKNLYKAKNEGRNRVSSDEDEGLKKD
ncbi:diguanylate cyclase [Hydrogenimonas cancrithermarum]|uniref:diguanylate cyclase n=1 Tax=Hydrogenimonas cancrithermarum TaxID=2993563 RepID=A0ABM8FLA2_9BACT|nr:diguanylate cyclase [Hydrogenimonas cancrithermarum]BDY13125.1 hypothetical protein HCR_14370 [Hydrogenimonas cancrithermarum]